MQYVTVTIPNELVGPSLRAIGDFGRLHVVDLAGHQVSKQQFAYKKRLGEIADAEKKLRAVEEQITKRNIPIGHIDWDEPLCPHSEAALARHPDIITGASEFATEMDSTLTSNMAFERTIQTEIARREELRQVLLASTRLLPAASAAASANENEVNARLEQYAARGAVPMQINSDGGVVGAGLDDLSHARGNGAGGLGEGLTSYICGVIPVKTQSVFQRVIYRISRGANAVVKFEQLPEPMVDPATGESVAKSVFCVVTIGRQLHRRVYKLCPLVNATVYALPPDHNDNIINSEVSRLEAEIREQRQALERTTLSIHRVLTDLATPQDNATLEGAFSAAGSSSSLRSMGGSSSSVAAAQSLCTLRMWQQLLFRERQTIDTLMKCEFHTTLVFLAAWCPARAVDELARVLASATEGMGGRPALDANAPAPVGVKPPTSVLTNKFTASFQSIVNTYGMPRYREFNPGLFTIVTFPFLFGIMFGDMGHGVILTLAGLLFLIFEKPLLAMKKAGTMNEMLDMVFSGRYIIFLMGLFATYIGIIYNDMMSIPVNAQGSNFINHNADTVAFKPWNGMVQSFGVDSAWYHNKNSLKFFNSLKMKMAIIIGVIHMTFGMCLSLKNHFYFRDTVAIVFEFIPRMLFLLLIFGWMCCMIVIKWCTDWRVGWNPADVPGLVSNPPNLIQTTIDMFLSAGSVPKDEQLFEGQALLQSAFVIIALVSIPIMLVPKPLIEHFKRQGKLTWLLHSPADDDYLVSTRGSHGNAAAPSAGHDEDDDHHPAGLASLGASAVAEHSVSLSPSQRGQSSSMDGGDSSEHGGEHAAGHGHGHSLSDSFIHQAIHTIEFVLGAVSNTASYLRLWALSLAHAQLAEVFWEKLLVEIGLEGSGFYAFIGSYAWMGATLGVIIMMDSLECFLHALRLHWVEFQNKFYYADGYAFKPFVFKPELD